MSVSVQEKGARAFCTLLTRRAQHRGLSMKLPLFVSPNLGI